MRILLDEDVPLQLLEPLRRLLEGHDVQHVDRVKWKGKKDCHLLPDARNAGFHALLTNDSKQLSDVDETRAIRESGLHHIRYTQNTRHGLDGLATAVASVLAAIRQVVRDLEAVQSQRLVEIQAIKPGKRHQLIDPRKNPPPYWGRGVKRS